MHPQCSQSRDCRATSLCHGTSSHLVYSRGTGRAASLLPTPPPQASLKSVLQFVVKVPVWTHRQVTRTVKHPLCQCCSDAETEQIWRRENTRKRKKKTRDIRGKLWKLSALIFGENFYLSFMSISCSNHYDSCLEIVRCNIYDIIFFVRVDF